MSRDVSNVVMEVCHQRIHMPRDGRSVLIKVCVVREKTCLGMPDNRRERDLLEMRHTMIMKV